MMSLKIHCACGSLQERDLFQQQSVDKPHLKMQCERPNKKWDLSNKLELGIKACIVDVAKMDPTAEWSENRARHNNRHTLQEDNVVDGLWTRLSHFRKSDLVETNMNQQTEGNRNYWKVFFCFCFSEVLMVDGVCVLQADRKGTHRKADQDAPQRNNDAERPGERHL